MALAPARLLLPVRAVDPPHSSALSSASAFSAAGAKSHFSLFFFHPPSHRSSLSVSASVLEAQNYRAYEEGFRTCEFVKVKCEGPPAGNMKKDTGDFGGERKCKIYTARDVALGLIDVFGWSVEVDGKGEVGRVAEILHIGRLGAGEDGITTPYEYILKVVRPFCNEEESGEGSLTKGFSNHHDEFIATEIKILIPIVNEFMEHIDPVKKRLLVKPPAGLLELAARPEAIAKLGPEIRLFCNRYAKFLEERFDGKKRVRSANSQAIVHSYMPTRDQMFAVGRADLVRRIKKAGGFLYVANALGLKSTRRPNGFWDDLQRLDFEIECFLLESWVKHVRKETGEVYFKNPVSNEVAYEKSSISGKPANVMNGKSSSVDHDVHSNPKVMPRMKLLGKAGRWDLHHAIVWNGGYREVAQLLGRRMIRKSKKSSE